MTRRRVGLAFALAAGAVLAWALMRGGGAAAPAAPAPSPARAAADPMVLGATGVPADPEAAAAVQEQAPPAPVDEAQARADMADHAKRSLELYDQTMQYPASSRPADGSNLALSDWNHGWPEGQPFAADDDRREITVMAQLDRRFAGPGEALAVSVEVYRPDGGTHVPFAPSALSASVQWIGDDGAHDVAAIALAPGGPGVTGSFVPSQIEALAASPHEARVLVHVESGEFYKDLSLPFGYTAAPSFEVTGAAGDRLVDGSLEIELAVSVTYADPTLIQGTLYDAHGTRVAVFDDYFRPTATGAQRFTMRFYGKAIRDGGLDGPYRLGALHGHVRVPDADPLEQQWARADDPPIWTAAYHATDFTDQPWTSPEKEAKEQQYRDLMQP